MWGSVHGSVCGRVHGSVCGRVHGSVCVVGVTSEGVWEGAWACGWCVSETSVGHRCHRWLGWVLGDGSVAVSDESDGRSIR